MGENCRAQQPAEGPRVAGGQPADANGRRQRDDKTRFLGRSDADKVIAPMVLSLSRCRRHAAGKRPAMTFPSPAALEVQSKFPSSAPLLHSHCGKCPHLIINGLVGQEDTTAHH